MTDQAPPGAPEVAREIASDVFCLGPWGRTQTVVYFVISGSSWVLIDAGWAKYASRIERAAVALFGADSRPAAILPDTLASWPVPSRRFHSLPETHVIAIGPGARPGAT